MDTAPDCSGENVKPQIIERYDGGDVVLPGSGETLSPAAFPGLQKLAGMTLITTDGTTLLGADDKARHRGDHDRAGSRRHKQSPAREALHRFHAG